MGALREPKFREGRLEEGSAQRSGCVPGAPDRPSPKLAARGLRSTHAAARSVARGWPPSLGCALHGLNGVAALPHHNFWVRVLSPCSGLAPALNMDVKISGQKFT